MTDKIAEIRKRHEDVAWRYYELPLIYEDRAVLLAEVERLRADLATQQGCCDGAAAQDAHIRREREEHRAEIERLREDNERLRAENELLREENERLCAEMPVAEALRVNAELLEMQRNDACVVVERQALKIVDLSAEVERLTSGRDEARAEVDHERKSHGHYARLCEETENRLVAAIERLIRERDEARAEIAKLRAALKDIDALNPDALDALVASDLRDIVAQMGDLAVKALEAKP